MEARFERYRAWVRVEREEGRLSQAAASSAITPLRRVLDWAVREGTHQLSELPAAAQRYLEARGRDYRIGPSSDGMTAPRAVRRFLEWDDTGA